jgi:ketosteroid isomerase-like protein
VSELDDFRSKTLARQAEAEEAIVNGDLAYTVGFERFNGSIGGRPVEPITVRVTHVYRREDGEWKIVHRHGDNPPDWNPPQAE